MLDRNAAIGIVHDYAQDIESHGVRLQEVILFGSFAKGTQHEWSDIDVAFLSSKKSRKPVFKLSKNGNDPIGITL